MKVLLGKVISTIKIKPFALLPPRMTPLTIERWKTRKSQRNSVPLPSYRQSNRDRRITRRAIGSHIRGTFKVKRDLLVVDCSLQTDELPAFYFKEPAPKKRTIAVWRDIGPSIFSADQSK